MDDLADDLAALYVHHLEVGAERAAQLGRTVADRADEIATQEVRWPSRRRWIKLIREELGELPDPLRTSVGVSLAVSFARGEDLVHPDRYLGDPGHTLRTSYFHGIAETKVAFSLHDLRLLLAVDSARARLSRTPHDRLTYLTIILDRAQLLLAMDVAGAVSVIDEVAARVLQWRPSGLDNKDVVRLQGLRERAAELSGQEVPPDAVAKPVEASDGFGAAVVSFLGDGNPWPAGISEFLAFLATASTAKPTPAWERRFWTLLPGVDNPGSLVENLLDLLATAPPIERNLYGSVLPLLLYSNDDLARGIVWSAALLNEQWTSQTLRRVALRCLNESRGRSVRHVTVQGEKVPFACIYALGRIADPASIAVLSEFMQTVNNRTVVKRIAEVLAPVAAERHLTVADLLEESTPDYGLDRNGLRLTTVGNATASIQLEDRSGATWSWSTSDERSMASPPPDIAADNAGEVEEAKSTWAAIRSAAVAERLRIEALLASRRRWPAHKFVQRYVDHPLSGWFGRRLVWSLSSPSGDNVVGIPSQNEDGFMLGCGWDLPEDGEVALWHPVEATDSEVQAVRTRLADMSVQQPFRQAWRETFRLDEVERTTGLYSNRYAGHILRHKQFYGLAKGRGWSGGYLSGGWDGGQSSRCHRDFTEAGLRIAWQVAVLDLESTDTAVDLCTTGRIQFEVIGEEDPVPVPLADVPRRVFSEAMRDVDLFVSVCTIANDLVWLERFSSEPRLHEYWDRVAADGLGTGTAARRQVLELLQAAGTLDGPYALSGEFLVVNGSLGTYKIELGTANVLFDPPGKWIAITASKINGQQQLRLPRSPVTDDEVLDRIIHRAMLLADDKAIRNKALLRAIRSAS